jgi:pyruvate formate-lyase activating enzyme-like uncharacterized protein
MGKQLVNFITGGCESNTHFCYLKTRARTHVLLVINATFSNISAILQIPVLVVEEIRVPGERTTDHGQATVELYHLQL